MIEYRAKEEVKIDKNIIVEGESVFLNMLTSEITVVMRYDGTYVNIPTSVFSEKFKMVGV